MRRMMLVKPVRGCLLLIINCSLLILVSSCSNSRLINKQAQQFIINDSSLAAAHVGICVYNATDDKYLYNYQSNKNFIPASNTKIFTCYAAMKYLGDSLVGLRYKETDSSVIIYPTGDPTFLHSDFTNQPVIDFLNRQQKPIVLCTGRFSDEIYGVGWSWDDYNDDYMAERSEMPVYGNTAAFHLASAKYNTSTYIPEYQFRSVPRSFENMIHFSADSASIVYRGTYGTYSPKLINLKRNFSNNDYFIYASGNQFKDIAIPFHTTDIKMVAGLLQDTLHKKINIGTFILNYQYNQSRPIHSQSADSLLKIMMHRSDNFYAEQSLLMVSNEKLGVMNDEKIIDTLLKTDLKELPQHPQWVDGSGLSRFNLFSPQDFVFILKKMRNDYGWNRITTIFETGGTGTLGGYYKNLTGKIYAKTGSLSNNIALSGYLITPKNKILIFSVLVNNHTVSSTVVRRAVERFLTQVQGEN